MGGHALKTVKTRRLEAREYGAITRQLVDDLNRLLPGSRPAIVRSYRAKESFGDVDIILDKSGLPDGLPDFLRENFACREVVPNGEVCSFDYRDFQVDLIQVKPGNYQTAVDYLAWNDAGNLIGRIAHKMGFKFGFNGLSYQLRAGTHLVKEILVSQDMPKVFAFLGFTKPGFTYANYQVGFEQLEDMFKFVASSTYFYPEIYHLDNTNHANRIRDRKRPSYHRFLAWVAPMEHGEAEASASAMTFGTKEYHLSRALKTFPGLGEEIEQERARMNLIAKAKSKFNGALVSQWTGRKAKNLGALMRLIREGYPQERAPSFEQWVVERSESELKDYVQAKERELDGQEAQPPEELKRRAGVVQSPRGKS